MSETKARDVIAEALRDTALSPNGEAGSANEYEVAADIVLFALREAGLLAEWRKIEDAPKDGTMIDLFGIDFTGEPARWSNCRWREPLYDEDPGCWEQQYAEAEGSFFPLTGKSGDERIALTHFMPLPSPPRDTSPGEESP